jgi:hypothetical protein
MRDLTQLDRFRVDLPAEAAEKMGVTDIKSLDRRTNGAFVVPCGPVFLRIIAAAGGGWDHISVSLPDRCPTWHEMSFVHRVFFAPNVVAMQLHVPERDHINNHPFVLHIWRPHSKLRRIPMPPKDFV